jgi:hypothetical protein
MASRPVVGSSKITIEESDGDAKANAMLNLRL